MQLLSAPSLVESPFIIVKIGEFTFGQADKKRKGNLLSVTYPNYVNELSIIKINGEVNTYTLKLIYAVSAGDDPNLLDKVFSSVADTRTLTISYGDWSSPGFIYKEEEALITNVKSDVDITSARITYTVTCVSKALSLTSNNFNFPARVAKPSDVIIEMLQNVTYNISEVFPGMRNIQNVLKNNLIATDDQPVALEAKPQTNVIEYINYLISCMRSISDSNINQNNATDYIGKSVYKLSIVDDNKNKMDGSYFTVSKISASENYNKLSSGSDAYEIDVGFPGDNFITGFSLKDTEQWSILYNTNMKVNQKQYQYTIDRYGAVQKHFSPTITRSKSKLKTLVNDRSWWGSVTEFPITCNITLKGLVRPSILMSYVKLNVLFYGQKHISSGMYVITKQQDVINSSGYKTNLELLRVGGD